jgi:hypothetical protein
MVVVFGQPLVEVTSCSSRSRAALSGIGDALFSKVARRSSMTHCIDQVAAEPHLATDRERSVLSYGIEPRVELRPGDLLDRVTLSLQQVEHVAVVIG